MNTDHYSSDMTQIGKLLIFYAIIVIISLTGIMIPEGLITYREVTCSNYSKCPDDGPNRFDICVKITDFAGKESILPVDKPTRTLGEVQKCYTNGLIVTLINPATRLIPMFIVFGGTVIVLVFFDICGNRDDNVILYRSQINQLLSMTMYVVIVVTLILSGFIYVYYGLSWQKVSCTGYVSDGIYQPVDKVSWVDTYLGTVGTSFIGEYSFQPNVLPEQCWAWADKVIFYWPGYIYIILSILSKLICGICLLWKRWLNNKASRVENSEADPLIPIA
ncbi:MAG: hypothetical protein Hyperionvirus2_94 [Hyperionvirus sp.]|uniref:Uncharacterized protein n=1 Tax=Hyperionvirus sp. TaxID=2487770 RepID=A0A3G5A650_9VIRU|nr:MAG: hypothetical protein Hyperionvirus2_94 [Hyperionvirus sp.]